MAVATQIGARVVLDDRQGDDPPPIAAGPIDRHSSASIHFGSTVGAAGSGSGMASAFSNS